MLYPTIPVDAREVDQSFRLTHVSNLDAFLTQEAESRRRMQKKYQRTINITREVSAGVGVTGLGMEAAGVALVTTGVGAPVGIVLASLGAGAFIVDLACGLITHKCSAKLAKHTSIETMARTKLNTIHQLVSKALIDGSIDDMEFKLISDEIERYQLMKEEIRSKARKPTDEAAKNEWLEKGREEIRAEFSKYMATFSVPQK